MRRNDKFLLKLWIPAILLLVFVGYGLTKNILSNPVNIFIPCVALLVCVMIRVQLSNNVKKALQQKTPSRLIRTLIKPFRTMKMSSTKEAYTAYHTALSHVLYGHYKEAADVMSSIDWTSKEPMFQALDLNIKSLISYFNGDISLGLSYSRKAKALASTSSFPGAKKSQDAYEAYIQIGQVMYEANHDEIVQSLEHRFSLSPLLLKLIIAWGLMNVYKERNQVEDYNRLLTFCRTHAPHCHNLIPLSTLKAGQDEMNLA